MAGDWLPIRLDLWDDPRVVRIARTLDCGRAAAVGACVHLWSLANRYSEDGKLTGYDADALDNSVGIQGFAAALAEAGWLLIDGDTIVVPDFDRFNSRGAKRRLKHSATTAVKRNVCASKAHKTRTSTAATCAPGERTERAPEKRTEEDRTEEVVDDGSCAEGGLGGASDDKDEWAAVTAELFDAGLNDALGAVAAARERGGAAKDVRALFDVWLKRRVQWAEPHVVLYRRVQRWRPGCDATEGWPPPCEEWSAMQRADEKRKADAGRDADIIAKRKTNAELRAKSLADYRPMTEQYEAACHHK